MARPPKALVVDDLPLNRLILGKILHKLGFEVLEAENGLQCIDVYDQERTQLVCVFLDLQMPVADGWAVLRALESRAPSEQTRVPVVVCTASCLDDLAENGQTVAELAVALGADGAVRKPLTTFAVQQILDEYAPRWRCCADDDDGSPPLAKLLLPVPASPLQCATASASGPFTSEPPNFAAAAHDCAPPPHLLRPEYHHRGSRDHPSPPLQPPQQQQQQRGRPCRSEDDKQPHAGGGGGGSSSVAQRQCGAPASPPPSTPIPPPPEGAGAARAACSGERRTLSGAVRPGREPSARELGWAAGGTDAPPPPKRPSLGVGGTA